jgi:hypothetical protein
MAATNNADYTAPSTIIVQDINAVAFGVDFFKKWLRAGAEYEIYDSTFSSYNSRTFLFKFSPSLPDEASSLGITFTEGWTDYRSADRHEAYYSAIGRYHRGVTRHLGFDIEAGATRRTGTIVEEFLAAVRPSIHYTIGKLSLRAGYDFEYQDTQRNQQRTRQTFYFRGERAF